ncbi:hypothetical protein HDU97_005948 [Phlyctochytrium planicorne]|nr:hypothetical protein HDU97_005948 [Phlyctochytrium planicorne]
MTTEDLEVQQAPTTEVSKEAPGKHALPDADDSSAKRAKLAVGLDEVVSDMATRVEEKTVGMAVEDALREEDAEVEEEEAGEDEEDEDDESIYPDTAEFYAWLSEGGPSGAFLAAHGAETMDAALAAIANMEEKKKAEGADVEKLKESVKEIVDDAIDNAYCITLGALDTAPKAAESTEASSSEEPKAVEENFAAMDCKELRDKVENASKEKRWMKIKVARGSLVKDGDVKEAISVTMADLDPREGYIIPKISGWKYLVDVEAAEEATSKAIGSLMETYLS